MNLKTFASSLLLGLLLSSCGPRTVTVNPHTNSESDTEGYLRIIGDLRWDHLRSLKDWNKRFPGCFNANISDDTLTVENKWNDLTQGIQILAAEQPACHINVGGIDFFVQKLDYERVYMGNGQTTKQLNKIWFYIPSDTQYNAFKTLIQNKYQQVPSDRTEIDINQVRHTPVDSCSLYTCFTNTPQIFWVYPTSKTLSILSPTKLDASSF